MTVRPTLRATALSAATAMTAPMVEAATLSAGYDPSLLSPYTVGARYRTQSTGKEHYVGINDLGAGPRSEAEFAWVNGTVPFAFSFDSATGMLTSTLGASAPTSFAATPGLLGDALHLTLANRSRNSAVFSIGSLSVNGESLPDLTCTVWCDWMVTDFILAPTLSVTGNISFTGTMHPNDSERVKFQVTSSTVDASSVVVTPLPPGLPLTLAGLGALAMMRRVGRKGAGGPTS